MDLDGFLIQKELEVIEKKIMFKEINNIIYIFI